MFKKVILETTEEVCGTRRIREGKRRQGRYGGMRKLEGWLGKRRG